MTIDIIDIIDILPHIFQEDFEYARDEVVGIINGISTEYGALDRLVLYEYILDELMGYFSSKDISLLGLKAEKVGLHKLNIIKGVDLMMIFSRAQLERRLIDILVDSNWAPRYSEEIHWSIDLLDSLLDFGLLTTKAVGYYESIQLVRSLGSHQLADMYKDGEGEGGLDIQFLKLLFECIIESVRSTIWDELGLTSGRSGKDWVVETMSRDGLVAREISLPNNHLLLGKD